MPSVSGTSVKGMQRLFVPVALTVARFDLVFPSTPVLNPARVGFAYVIGRLPSGTFQNYVVAKSLVYRPGNILFFPALSNYSSLQWTLDVDWNAAGIGWRVDYT